MQHSTQYRLSTAELRARIGSQTLPRKQLDPSSLVIVGAAMLTAPLAMWLISLFVRWAA